MCVISTAPRLSNKILSKMSSGAACVSPAGSALLKSTRKRRGLSFAGGGLMCVYHTGMGLAMQHYAPHYMNQPDIQLYGASAGAVFSVCIACGLSPMYMYHFAKECHEWASSLSTWWLGGLGSLHPKYDIFTRLRSVIEEYLPHNAHRLCNGKVNISLTLFPSFKNWIVSDFNTRAELIQVHCVCYHDNYTMFFLIH